jgi:hypothetical protein
MPDLSSFTITFVGAEFGEPVSELAAPVLLDSQEFDNATPGTGTMNWSINKTFSAQASVTVTRGLNLGFSLGFEFDITTLVGKVGQVTFGSTLSMSYSTASTNSSTTTQSFAEQFTINVPAHTHVVATATVLPQRTTLPFKGRVRVKGVVPARSQAFAFGLQEEFIGALWAWYSGGPNDAPIPASDAWRGEAAGPPYRRYFYPESMVYPISIDGATVIDGFTIECELEGVLEAIVGTKVRYVASEFAPDGTKAGEQLLK